MDLRDWLQQGFDYDEWANRRWADHLGAFQDAARAFEVFQHIFTAQKVWLERCGWLVEFDRVDEDFGKLASYAARAWRELLDEADLDAEVAYRTMAGESYRNTVGSIALHVLNHGTYHRGHLRGLAEAEGQTGFPETDLIVYLRETGG